MRERPDDTLQTQTGAHMRVICNIEGIVVVDELVADRLSKHGPRKRDQKAADGEL